MKSTIIVRELFHIPEFMINQTFSFRTAYLPFSFDVAECVISRDEQEYYGDTARHWFLLK